MVVPSIRVLEHGEKPSKGFVRRPHPVVPEFISHASWWPRQEWQQNGSEGMVYLWIPKEDNRSYEKFVARKRFCPNYHRQRYGKISCPKHRYAKNIAELTENV